MPRSCAVCGAQIQWCENGNSIVALDMEPDLEGQYLIVEGKAYLVDLISEKARAMHPGPLFRNHVMTCKPKGRKAS